MLKMHMRKTGNCLETQKLDNILKFLFENTEISSEVVELFIFCGTKEEFSGDIVAYIHQPEGIFYVWRDYGGVGCYLFKKEHDEYFDTVVVIPKYIESNIKEWFQDIVHTNKQ
jgi:hypothetical protein